MILNSKDGQRLNRAVAEFICLNPVHRAVAEFICLDPVNRAVAEFICLDPVPFRDLGQLAFFICCGIILVLFCH